MTGGRTCYGGVFSSPRLCFWFFLWTTTILIGEVYTLTTPSQDSQNDDAGDCVDTIDCSSYDTVGCTDDAYKTWAKKYCPKTCGLCQDLLAPATTEAPKCEDRLTNCSSYEPVGCTQDVYRHWANKYCRMHCKLCADPTVPPSKGPPPPPCVDNLPNCAEYGRDTCTNFAPWATVRCRRTCRFCTESQLQEIDGVTTPPPTTTTAAPCVDTIANCAGYGKDKCISNKPWASVRCRRFCRFCTASQLEEIDAITTTKPPCVNKISNCDIYDKDTCKNFKSWAEDRCNKFCGYCTGD